MKIRQRINNPYELFAIQNKNDLFSVKYVIILQYRLRPIITRSYDQLKITVPVPAGLFIENFHCTFFFTGVLCCTSFWLKSTRLYSKRVGRFNHTRAQEEQVSVIIPMEMCWTFEYFIKPFQIIKIIWRIHTKTEWSPTCFEYPVDKVFFFFFFLHNLQSAKLYFTQYAMHQNAKNINWILHLPYIFSPSYECGTNFRNMISQQVNVYSIEWHTYAYVCNRKFIFEIYLRVFPGPARYRSICVMTFEINYSLITPGLSPYQKMIFKRYTDDCINSDWLYPLCGKSVRKWKATVMVVNGISSWPDWPIGC